MIERNVDAAIPLEATYLGSGGWIFRYDGQTVVTGPFFTHRSLVDVGLRPIESDTLLVDEEMSRWDISDAAVILVGHGHYDHLLDVPRVAQRHAPRARIGSTETVRNLLGHWSGLMDRVDVLEPYAGDVETPGEWVPFGPRVRVLPLRSNHGPHFDGLELFDGSVDRPLDERPRTARDWLTGETLAFLIDLIDADGEIAYRIYYHDAVAAPPYGLAPPSEIARRAVDLAVVVPATYDQVDWHPEALVENVRPGRILLGHWEDFFIPIGTASHAFGLADIEDFEARLSRVFDGEFFRPEVGTRFRFGPDSATAR